ncbi:hypothetical protein FRC03_012747 [Tulasnella sp. 419]|nr:hypothetical protein FRC03_012747 [Tulasnella sp. 419]
MVGGGIFRHPGSEALRKKTDPSAPIPAKFEGNANTNTKTSNEVASSSNKIATPAAPRDIPQPPLKPPASLFDFNKSWTTLPTPEGRWELLQHIPPTSLPNLFLTSLEPSMLVSILKDFISVLSTSPSESPKILEYMTNFPKVKRFSTIIMFLNREEAEVVQKVWSILRPNQKVGEDESKGWV